MAGWDCSEAHRGAQHYVTVGQGSRVVVGQPAVAGVCQSARLTVEQAHHMRDAIHQWFVRRGRDRETVSPNCLRHWMLFPVLPATVPN